MTHHDTPSEAKKKNFNDVAVGVILAICVYFLALTSWNQYWDWQEKAPATNWVEVTSFNVPNFVVGANPSIDYVRNIKQAVSSSWTSEVRRYHDDSDNYELACTNSGFSELEPGRAAPTTGWFLSSFVGEDCKFTPGRHRVYVTWNLSPKGYDRTIRYNFTSNTFFVGE